jgi:endonuclease/exonuclease/phosphatase family metal-dependent hydrolase
MRLASFNVENLFDRAKAFNAPTPEEARTVLEAHARINQLLNLRIYTGPVKDEIVELLGALELLERDDGGPFVLLRQNRGKLLKRPQSGGVEITAGGRGDWIGWVELKTEPVDELATRHTAQVITDVEADVVAVVEAENRIALQRFSTALVEGAGGGPYSHVMVIDGNDERGIDVGIMSKAGFDLGEIRTHVTDVDDTGRIFSRDCPEYTITTPAGERVVVLVNHFKSKGFGSQATSNALRRRQARRVADIYRRLRDDGLDNVAVVGDLNDTPDSDPLQPLIEETDLRDVSEHPDFESDGRPGTFANGNASNKIDYILLSPALFDRTTAGSVFRKGVWGGKHGDLFPHYETMTSPAHAASDHAAIWAEVAV